MTFWKTVGANIVAQVIVAVTMSILYVGFAAAVIASIPR